MNAGTIAVLIKAVALLIVLVTVPFILSSAHKRRQRSRRAKQQNWEELLRYLRPPHEPTDGPCCLDPNEPLRKIEDDHPGRESADQTAADK